jgi:hypothetical protein
MPGAPIHSDAIALDVTGLAAGGDGVGRNA